MIERWPLKLASGAVARPRWTLAVLLLLTAAAAPGLLRLELLTDGHALVPPDDPAVRLDADVRQHFALRDPIMLLVVTAHPRGIFNLETLTRIRRLSERLAGLEGVGDHQVTSLATERRDRVSQGSLELSTYLDPLPDSPRLMAQLEADVDAVDILSGTLVSADRTAATILVGAPAGDSAARTALYRRILDLALAETSPTDRVLVVGAPVAEAILGLHILTDLVVLLPLAMGVIALVIWQGCRRLWGVGLALLEVGACLSWTFGLMGWLGIPVYLTTAMLPIILTTIGLADEIHLFWHYQHTLEQVPDKREALLSTLRRMVRPVSLTSWTTSFAFLSFVTSPIAPIRFFGLFAALGTLICMLWSLTAIPAFLALLPAAALQRRPGAGRGVTRAVVRALIRLSSHPRRTLAAVAALTLLLGSGLGRLHVQDSWIEGFAKGSAFRQATDRANQLLHGTHLLLVHLTYEPPASPEGYQGRRGPLLSHRLLAATGELEDFLRRQPQVGGVLGPYSHFMAVDRVWSGPRLLPEDPRVIDLTWRRFDWSRGEHRRREVADDALRRAVVTVFLGDTNYRDTLTLMRAVRDYETRRLAPLDVRLDFAGDVEVSRAMVPAIVRTQVRSLLLALGGALLAVSLLHRSLAVGACAVLPAAVGVLWVFGAMGWLGIPLGVATSMFCAITLGIGIDYAIHLLERYRQCRERGVGVPLATSLEQTAPAILTDTLAIAGGFGLLTLSQVPATARLGLSVAVALAAVCLLTLAGLGSLLAWWRHGSLR